MVPVVKKTIAILSIFLIPPIVALCLSWHWEPTSLNYFSKYLFWITETAGLPWAVLTAVFLYFVFCVALKIRTLSGFFKLGVILVGAMLVGQGIKSIVKTYTSESRPFVLWIEETYSVDDAHFYSMPRSEREEIISDHVESDPEIPAWLSVHWKNETGYSFPSGHTLFATTWAFLAILLIGFRHHHFLMSVIIGWAIFIEISRLALGMHHPRDLILGSLFAYLISLGAYFCAKRWRIVE